MSFAVLVLALAGGAGAETVYTKVSLNAAKGVPERGDSGNAIDGNTGTNTYTTPPNTTLRPAFLEVGFASQTTVDHIRIFAIGDYGPYDYTIQWTSSTDGDLDARSYTTVTNMVNGINGAELMDAASVNSDGTVVDATAPGDVFESLTFDPVSATGMRIAFSDTNAFNHWHVAEVEVYASGGVTAPTTSTSLDPASPDGDNTWYVSDVTPTVSAVADGGAAVDSIRCQLDGQAPSSFDDMAAGCDYVGSTAVSDDGEHTLYAAAANTDGYKSSVVSSAFKIDKTAPLAFISSGPAPIVKGTSAVFGYEAVDNEPTAFDRASGLASVECSLDGAAFTLCDSASQQTYTGLAIRSHSFWIRSTDQAGNQATSDLWRWTNGKPPKTTISPKPSKIQPEDVNFSFVSTDPGAQFQCKLDGGPFANCTSPKQYLGLAEGSHIFLVKGLDAAGRGNAAPFQFKVDATAPAQPTFTVTPPATTPSTKAQFVYRTSEKATFMCRLDAAPFAPCKSSANLKNLAAGAHQFDVYAVDAAGNTSPTASYNWTIG